MLTIRFDQLGLQPGDLVLDAGAGFGRHAFELRPPRRQRRRARLRRGRGRQHPRRRSAAMVEAGEIADERFVGVLQGDATRLPFADGTLRPGDHQRGARAHPGRRRRDRRAGARAASPAARSPPPCRRGSPRRSTGCSATSTTRRRASAATCASTRATELKAKLRSAGLERHRQPPRPRAALAVLVAEVRGRPAQRRPSAGEASTASCSSGRSSSSRRRLKVARARARRRCSARAIVVYGRKQVERPMSRVARHRRRAQRRRGASQTAESIASLQLDTGMIPWFPGGHCDPWNHVETAMALDVAGLHARGRAGLRVAGRHPARRRQLVELLPARRLGRGGQARHQRVRLHRHRRVAPLAVHLGPRLRRPPVADGRSARSTGCCRMRTRRRHRRCGRRTADDTPVGLRAAHRVVAASPTRCAAAPAWPRSSTSRDPTGSPPPIVLADVDRRPPRRVRTEGALGDGLVLPGARPAASPASRPRPAWPTAGTTFAMEGTGIRCVSDEPWVTASRDRRVRDRLRRDRRPGHGDRPARLDPAASPRRRRVLHRHRLPVARCASRSTRPRRTPAPRSSSPPTRSTARRRPAASSRPAPLSSSASSTVGRSGGLRLADRPTPAAQFVGQHVGREATDQQGLRRLERVRLLDHRHRRVVVAGRGQPIDQRRRLGLGELARA